MLPLETDIQSYLPSDRVRLVVTDLDDTLIGSSGEIPDELWPLIQQMNDLGIMFAPASGRQFSTLMKVFEPFSSAMPIVSCNGGVVSYEGKVLYSDPLPQSDTNSIIRTVRKLSDEGIDVGVIYIGENNSYIERHDDAFVAIAEKYFHSLVRSDDLLLIKDRAVKMAIYSFDGLEKVTPALDRYEDSLELVSSAENWIDLMSPGTDKGAGVKHLQEYFDISADETVVFGDYLNDLGLMGAGTYSFAVANAHPAVIERANYIAPSCEEKGVVEVLTNILEGQKALVERL